MAFGLKDKSPNWFRFTHFQMYSSVKNILNLFLTAAWMHLKILFREQEESYYLYSMSKIVKMKYNGRLLEVDWRNILFFPSRVHI